MTLLTVCLALVLVSMWVRAVTPVLAESQAATQAALGTTLPATRASMAVVVAGRAAGATTTAPTADKSVKKLVKGTMTLSFMLITLMLIVGIFASLREWVRYRALRPAARGRTRTKYVDVWKIAGDRAKIDPQEDTPADGSAG